MEASYYQEIISFIERSEKILLCTHRKPDGDAVGSIMALHNVLTLLGKKVTAVCADKIPENFLFLPGIDHLSQNVPGGKDFVVTLDCDKAEVDRLKYHLEDNKVHIIITPKNGRFFSENISCQEGTADFDLIITVDVADIAQLGRLYKDNVDLFTSIPWINIDHHVSNDSFGKINLIEVNASSTSEILYKLIRQLENRTQKNLLLPETATFLLSGVTTDTSSFQNANTTPQAMEIAATLMDIGANQQDIVRYLFRTKQLSTLKLWGRVLTKIELDVKHRLIWSTVTQRDIKASGAPMDEVGEIIDELLIHAPEAEIVALFKEDTDLISVSLRSKTPQINVMDIAMQFGGGGHVMAAGAKFPGKTLPEVMSHVLLALQKKQQQRLGLSEEITDSKSSRKPVTQVLEGYTPKPMPISPSLEERVVEESRSVGTAEASTKMSDIHQVAKAAITAEQNQVSESAFIPSQEIKKKERVKPPTEKRFTEEIPSFLKAKPSGTMVSPADAPSTTGEAKPSSSPTPAPTELPQSTHDNNSSPTVGSITDDVKVSYGNQSAKPPIIHPSSSKPTEEPKDPFAFGDDGLTDIERALGGL